MPHTSRTAAEQKYWDEISKSLVTDCFRRTMKPAGCSRLAREVADLMLTHRQQSIEAIANGKRNGRTGQVK